MITEDKVIEIFYMADEYSREFSKVRQKYSLDEGRNDGKRRRNKPNRMSDAEIMVILILFHTGGFRCFKHFYLEYVSRHMRHLFPVLSSYSRFVELEKEVALCLALFIKDVLLGKCTGISFTDSTALRVCHIKRMHSHRTFSGLAQKGKTTMGWFYGFKLHLIINDRGEILNFIITPGNTGDRDALSRRSLRLPSPAPFNDRLEEYEADTVELHIYGRHAYKQHSCIHDEHGVLDRRSGCRLCKAGKECCHGGGFRDECGEGRASDW